MLDRKKAARTGVGTKLDGPGRTDTILQAVEGLRARPLGMGWRRAWA